MSTRSQNKNDLQVIVRLQQAERPSEGRRPAFSNFDLIVFAAILVLGAFAVVMHPRISDFLGEDVFYADAAKSLLHHGFYGINGTPETTQPPGLPGILALVFAVFGYSYGVCAATMAVCETLGFLLVYELLRRRGPKLVAASICIVLMTSPLYFEWATRMVFACFPYFFTTMLTLLASEEYEQALTTRSKMLWGTAMAVALATSLMIATSTAALMAAMVAAILFTYFKDHKAGRTRLLRFLPIVVVGVAVLGWWMHRKPTPLEWPLPGYPAPYLQQLQVKNGNHPELGMATWSDIPERIITNAFATSDVLVQLILRHGINETKIAVVIVPVLLVLMGWIFSSWRNGAKDVIAWYFAGYSFIYLLWPWKMEPRFLFPIAPLACLYLWQGFRGIACVVRTRPRVSGIICFPLAILLGISGVSWMYQHRTIWFGDLPDEVLIPMWFVVAAYALWMARTGKPISVLWPSRGPGKWINQLLAKNDITPLQLARVTGSAALLVVIAIGPLLDMRVARQNMHMVDLFTAEDVGWAMCSEVDAGMWLRIHTPTDSVVMARHLPIVYHYAERKLIWFAPISNPSVLLQGIAKYHVNYIVVIKHASPYYLPDDDYCFDRLLAKDPSDFQLILQEPNIRIFEVDEKLSGTNIRIQG